MSDDALNMDIVDVVDLRLSRHHRNVVEEVDPGSALQLADRLYLHSQNLAEKNSTKSKSINVLLVLLAIAVTAIIAFYSMSQEAQTSLILQAAKTVSLEKQTQFLLDRFDILQATNKWIKESEKKVTDLTIEDISLNPIDATPKKYIPYIMKGYKDYGTPPSLTSAQILVESRFDENAEYLGYANDRILEWKQVPSTKGSYDIYVKYKGVRNPKWKYYNGEVSLGLGQQNIGEGANDTVKAESAKDFIKSLDFVSSRLGYLKDGYKKESLIFIAMAYNSVGAAKRGKAYLEYLERKKHNKDEPVPDGLDLDRADFVVNYGIDVVSIARNQTLIELYDDLFGKFKDKKELSEFIPEMRLIPVSQEDYRSYRSKK